MWRLLIFLLYVGLASFQRGERQISGSPKSPFRDKVCNDGPASCSETKYRSIDGSCNNLKHPTWGMPNRPYYRLAEYNYADDRHALPTTSSGEPLPSAKFISGVLFQANNCLDPEYTLLTMQYGQFVTHDMSLTADILQIGVKVQPVVCCNGTHLGPDASNTDRCAPIVIPEDDPDYGSSGIRCFDFTRTATTYDRGCSGPDEVARPLSVVTSWMDLSLVYGSSEEQARPIREYKCGRMLTATRHNQEWPPQVDNVTQTCRAAKSSSEPCYKTGDVRANQNPGLTCLQVIFLREHNRVANQLCKQNPHWSDDKTFNEARRIVVAEYQHITYTEYLPVILGEEYMVKEKILFPDAKKCIDDYDSRVDGSVSDEHANGGAFRNFHSAIIGHLQFLNEKGEETGIARLSDWLNRPLIQEANKTVSLDSLLRGMITQKQQCVDQFDDDEPHRFLFRGNGEFGINLPAFDLQRSRDHGVETYGKYREYCNLPVPKTFDHLNKICGISKENVRKLKKIYKKVEDIELRVGGALEPLLPGTLSGETFHCILMDTFRRSRRGDRFFYQNCEDNKFTDAQLRSIQKTSMSRVFCDNSKVSYIQPNAFEKVSDENDNDLISCKNLPRADLTLWQEKKKNRRCPDFQ